MSKQSLKTIYQGEITFNQIVDFLMESWKVVVIAGLFGLGGSIAYLWMTPNQYQATAQIKIAQINSSIKNTQGVNVEEPNALIARLRLPSSYSSREIEICGYGNTSNAEALAISIKLSALKGVNSIIELKINSHDRNLAANCAQALFENIKASQNLIIKPYVEEATLMLSQYNRRLSTLQSLVHGVNKTEDSFAVSYFYNRDEIRFLTEEIVRLNTFIEASKIHQANLVAPIYTSNISTHSKKRVNLIIGLIIGLFIGLLFSAAKKFYRLYFK